MRYLFSEDRENSFIWLKTEQCSGHETRQSGIRIRISPPQSQALAKYEKNQIRKNQLLNCNTAMEYQTIHRMYACT